MAPLAVDQNKRLIRWKAAQAVAIGELSRRTGVNIETIRYFERVGIVATPPRTSGGRRVYEGIAWKVRQTTLSENISRTV
ncbi:MerR family DNA-binding transcriptional regulator [Sphingomonas sp. CCH21-G11]|jgi:hypothetical protein|uniref:MerR family DNA-binding transcriptional regulator n=1 Tax=Sphingomonas sp. CCH21-G11 TaxID=1768749 RepID=UPI000830A74C|nr:MerR family DNA-binding transcriptional regulator [Sphingomonas sp. CCH21-G11]